MSTTYTVTGRWPFPLDMLRYDQAKPATEADAMMIAKASAENCATRDDLRRVWQITLESERSNYFLQYQSPERWRSFGWVSALDTEQHRVRERVEANPAEQALTAAELAQMMQRLVVSGASPVVTVDWQQGMLVAITGVRTRTVNGITFLELTTAGAAE